MCFIVPETTITKKIDNEGRIVIPSEIRKSLRIAIGEELKISIERQGIVIRKNNQECVFCGRVGATRNFKNKKICKCCEEEIRLMEGK